MTVCNSCKMDEMQEELVFYKITYDEGGNDVTIILCFLCLKSWIRANLDKLLELKWISDP